MVTAEMPNKRWMGGPQSILVNGKGHFNCSEGNVEAPWWRPAWWPVPQCHESQCPGLETFEVAQGNTYLLRFINAGTLTRMSFAIDGHKMKVVEVDGYPTQPYVTEVAEFNSGQRIAVLVIADQPIGVYAIRFKFLNDQWSMTTGHALLRYTGASSDATTLHNISIDHPEWHDNNFSFHFQKNAIRGLYTGAASLPAVPADEVVQRRFVMLITNEYIREGRRSNIDLSLVRLDDVQSQIGTGANRPEEFCDAAHKTEGNYELWAVARRIYVPTSTPSLSKLYFDIGSDIFAEENGYYQLEVGKVYDIVVQSYPACYGVCEVHSWHMHGTHFWVLGSFRGEWIGSAEQIAALNLVDPPYRDTVMNIPEGNNNAPNVEDGGCGYLVIRLVLNSPGVWPFHCHHAVDFMSGLGAVFYTDAGSIPAPPENLMLCGDMTVQKVSEKIAASAAPATTTSKIIASAVCLVMAM